MVVGIFTLRPVEEVKEVISVKPKIEHITDQESGRLEPVIGRFTTDTPAKAMVDALINDATTFGADMTREEEDDITVVVVKVL